MIRWVSIYFLVFNLFLKKYLLICLFLALLGLCCCTGLSLVAVIGGSSLGAVPGFLTAMVSFSGERALERGDSVAAARGPGSYGPQALRNRLISCGAQTQWLHGMWDLPRPGIKPMSPALAGGFFTTEPPGKSQCLISLIHFGYSLFLQLQIHKSVLESLKV